MLLRQHKSQRMQHINLTVCFRLSYNAFMSIFSVYSLLLHKITQLQNKSFSFVTVFWPPSPFSTFFFSPTVLFIYFYYLNFNMVLERFDFKNATAKVCLVFHFGRLSKCLLSHHAQLLFDYAFQFFYLLNLSVNLLEDVILVSLTSSIFYVIISSNLQTLFQLHPTYAENS